MKPTALLTPLLTAVLGFAGSALPAAQAAQATAQTPPAEFSGKPPLEWSRLLARSEMERKGDSLFHGSEGARWTYDRTLYGLALLKLADQTGEEDFAEFGARTAESFIRDDGSIADYSLEKYNIDLIAPGKVLLHRWIDGVRPDEHRQALATLRRQMSEHPRTAEGGFWHKKRYPHQMWLDGLFMASPFLAQYGGVFDEPGLFDEVTKQITLMDRKAWNADKQLHHHGWDEAREQDWADDETGLSANFWGRAVGWYAMALVDTLEFLPDDHPGRESIREVLGRVAAGIARWQDPESGLWYQVLDQGDREGNYLEGTASSMYVYALAKAINRGWLPREDYLPVVTRGYAGIVRDLIRPDEDNDGLISLTQCCEVAGLGFKNRDGIPRDGSFNYYISEPIIHNDHKGVGPFIMAGIELTRMAAAGAAADAPAAGDEAEEPDATVAADGSGDFTSIQAAIMAAPYQGPGELWTIAVRPGTYHERVYVQQERGRIRLLGEDPATTRLVHEVHAHMKGPDGKPVGTFKTPTLQIDGDGFQVENMTIENAAGPVGQALALSAQGDKLVFRNCRFLGWQDTIFVNRGRHYFEDCEIAGDCDFIFGAATSWFENCRIHCLDDGYITAASTPRDQPHGLVFRNCTITGEEGVKVYLGRPWRPHAMTVFLDCEMSDVVRPEGWHNWGSEEKEKTSRYGEFGSSGPGARPGERVAWAKQITGDQAAAMTPAAVLAGDDGWNPVRAADGRGAAATGWEDLDAILARIQPPEFPDRDFPITEHGARPDKDSTEAIQAAIDACHQAGGGRVVVPAGEWHTGALRLRSKVNLHVAKGAKLTWMPDLRRYPIVFTRWEGMECMNYSPLIYAFEEEDIAITGEGILDGGATRENWWGWNLKEEGAKRLQVPARDRLVKMTAEGVPVEERVFGEGDYLRPNFIQPYRCRNILIEGVTLNRSPMWNINPVLCENVTVRGVKVVTHGSNNDGCNPESSRDVLIEDCLFDTGDDCIAIKSGRNNDGRRIGVASENIVVRDCLMKDGHGGVVLGSECSGHIRNVFVENCRMDSPNLDRALRFKNNAVRGGILENVFMRNVTIGQVGEAVLTIDLLYEEGAEGDHQPVVRNVRMENITSSAAPRVFFIRGFEGAVVDDIEIRDSHFSGISETEVVEHAGAIRMENVTITPDKKVKSINTVPQR